MNTKIQNSSFQRIIETVEALPTDDQMLLIEIIRQRLIQLRRSELVDQVAEARQHYRKGNVRRGTAENFIKEMDKSCENHRQRILG